MIANFLAEAAGDLPHNGGLKASTVRNLFSLLSSALMDRGVDLSVCGTAAERHRLRKTVKGLMKRPDRSLPKKEKWDLSLLWSHWEKKGRALSITDLRAKVITLMMAQGLFRPSDLARLDWSTAQKSKEGVSIRVFRAKNSGAGYSNPVFLPFLPARSKNWCAPSALLEYVQRTDGERSPREDGTIPVFMSMVEPNSPLTSGRISAVAKTVLIAMGINCRVYSIRANAASLAVERGVDPALVQLHGNWKSNTVMVNHYLRHVDTSWVAATVASKPPGRKKLSKPHPSG